MNPHTFLLSLRAAFFSPSNVNAIAANCLLENEWGCIFDGNNRRPHITCCSGWWQHEGQCEHRPFWRNEDGTATERKRDAKCDSAPMQQHSLQTQFRRVYKYSPFLRVVFDSEGIHQAFFIVAEHKVIFLSEERRQLLMTTARQRNSDIFLEKFSLFLSLDPSNSALLLDSTRSQTRSFSSSCVRMWLWRRRHRGRRVVSRRWWLRRPRGWLAFLLVWIDVKFFRSFGNGNSFAVQNWTESRRYIRIHYCPLLFLRDDSRNRWYHTEVSVSCVITWPPPNHRNSKRHRMSCHSATAKDLLHTYGSICAGPSICLARRSCIRNTNDTPFSLLQWWPFFAVQTSLHCKCYKSYLHY